MSQISTNSYAYSKSIGYSLALCCLLSTGCSFTYVDGYMFDYKGKTANKITGGLISQEVQQIEITNKFGNVVVESIPGQGDWTWDAKTWATEQEDADEFLTQLEMEVEDNGSVQKWTVKLPERDSKLRGVRSDLTIKVDARVAVLVNNHHGDQNVSGIDGDVRLNTEHGKITASQLSGTTTITNEHGEVFAEELGGDAKLTCEHSTVSIRGVSGDLTLKCEHTDATIVDAQASVLTNSEHGDVEIESGGSHVQATSEHGDVTIRMSNSDFESLTVNPEHGDVDIYLPGNCQPNVRLRTEHGKIKSDFSSSDSAQAPRIKGNGEHADIKVHSD